ncbi:MAG: hypothetical protein ACI8ZN_001829 [Bacteroidia bacterium]|jgi:hypothetical protein
MIIYRFKITFEDVDEVERIIEVRASQSFADLYKGIVESIKFNPDVTASFYISGDNWRKGKEITNADKEGVTQMAECKLNTQVNDPHQKILLITHDEMEWSFRIQLFKIQKSDVDMSFPVCIKSIGVAPKQTKIVTIGLATNEFEELVDDIIREAEEPDVSEMGMDDDAVDLGDNSDEDEGGDGDDDVDEDDD